MHVELPGHPNIVQKKKCTQISIQIKTRTHAHECTHTLLVRACESLIVGYFLSKRSYRVGFE